MDANHIWTPPPEVGRIVAVVSYQDLVIVATEHGGVFELSREDVERDWTVRCLAINQRPVVE